MAELLKNMCGCVSLVRRLWGGGGVGKGREESLQDRKQVDTSRKENEKKNRVGGSLGDRDS